MRKSIFLITCACSSLFVHAQNILQHVTGRVEDEAVHSPLRQATLVLRNNDDSVFTTSDSLGFFLFSNVKPGRYLLKTSFTGYQPDQQEVLVISARNTIVNIALKEWPSVLEEVQISARGNSLETGEQSISIEKTLRIPANFFDPVRVITSYPGVVASNDQNNTIIVRGNSPANLLWRMNGLDVVNPNHLANAGTFTDKPANFGGGVNIISSQLLDRTDFYAGSLPSRYGNALSGVVDMTLREGNKEKNHYTLQASLIGLDAAAEGPLGEKKNTSFLVNYRYSTVGLLGAMGAKFGDEDINFQDFTFSINSRLSKERTLSLFGFFGASKNIFDHKETADWEIDKDRYDIDYDSKNFGTGLTFSQALNQVNISAGVSVSGDDQERNQYASPDIATGETNVVYEDEYKAKKFLVSAFGRVTARVNSSQLESGVYVNYLQDKLSSASQIGVSPITQTSGTVEGVLLQPYAQWRIFLSEKLIAQTAMRYVFYSYNESGLLEPRVSLEYFPSANNSLKFSYNLVSQLQSAGTYLNNNKELKLNKAHHLDMGYKLITNEGFTFSSSAYYQYLFDIPVQQTPSSYSTINSIETVAAPDLISNGVGNNYGVEVIAEKSFFDNSYFIAGGSWYKSTYEGSDEISRSTRFDGNYTVNLTYGREWSKTKKESFRTFGISSRILYIGGLHESPIIADPNSAYTVYDESKAFENKLADYFRWDLRLNWRKNKNGYTRTIAIDIQNVLNIQNEAYHYYDHVSNKIETQYQLGMIPILVYRVDF